MTEKVKISNHRRRHQIRPHANAKLVSSKILPLQKATKTSQGSVMSIENRIRRNLEINQPELVNPPEKFEQHMKQYQGKEQEYLNDLIAKHGPDPAASFARVNKKDHPKEASARQKLVALFTHYDRMQLPRIDE